METTQPNTVRVNHLGELLAPPTGSCPACGRHHRPFEPHVLDSAYYQLYFWRAHGRMPTEADAREHCLPILRTHWREDLIVELELRGLPVPEFLRGA